VPRDKRSTKYPKLKPTATTAIESITIRAQDVLDRLIDTLDSEHQRVALRREWRENPTPAERAYLALGLDGKSKAPEFTLEGRSVSAEFAAGYKYGVEHGYRAKYPAKPLSEIRIGESLLETAWGIIANASGGNWALETPEWQAAAARWRDGYHSKNSVGVTLCENPGCAGALKPLYDALQGIKDRICVRCGESVEGRKKRLKQEQALRDGYPAMVVDAETPGAYSPYCGPVRRRSYPLLGGDGKVKTVSEAVRPGVLRRVVARTLGFLRLARYSATGV